tara:strand:- start:1981 stop:13113 length:11133 start_codon:yes stop_codon:yes gene_type:complete
MAAVKTKRISALIESQLPEFISTEYELFAKFVQKYYEGQEAQGGPLDVLSNLQKYADIDYYEKNLLKQNDSLASTISATDTTIVLVDASSFPKKNGYVRIGNEIIFYASRTDTELLECSRGVSGNTTLGDLYSASDFQSTESAQHVSGEKVYNVSNLFLYALVKNFENQYLGSFPEKYLSGEIDKRTLIKNIQKFYKTKGTSSSIKFIFTTIVAKDEDIKPEVYNPKDFTYKASKSDWVNVFALKVKVISGDPKNLIGNKITQPETEEYQFVSATVDNVYPDGTADGEAIWNIVLAPETVTGEFAVSTKTTLEKDLPQTDGVGKRINAFSTIGWGKTGEILINQETIAFEEKNITQFIIKKRGDVTYNHSAGDSIYKPVVIEGSGVSLLTLGVVYNFTADQQHPYAAPKDRIQISNPGFETSDVKIVKTGTNEPRWILNQNLSVNIPTNPSVVSELGQTSTDISAIFTDDQYYYITSSGFPSYKILDGSTVTEPVMDQKLLRIIRKEATRTTEKYKTPKSEVGILLNGARLYGYKDTESIRFGRLESLEVNTQGKGYAAAPFVLLDGASGKARAVLSGNVVERYIVDTDTVFPRVPTVEVTSGRGAVVTAVVTGDEITSLVIDNPGEYYSSPPLVRITDSNGKGRFADYTSIVDTDGRITGFNKISGGRFYGQNTVKVDILPVGSGASATPLLTEWNYNRFEKLKSNLDTEYGHLFQNYNNVLEYGYGHVGNPKALRIALNDNISNSGTEPATKVHSPILGFAYDGNPIYGPFAHEDPLDSASSIIRMTSSYSLNGSRSNGPSLTQYPLGSFTNDYTYTHKSGTLDENNGRFCITPDFPKGTYAYFLTIDSDQVPQYPYIIGDNFYSLPVDSNYNSNINQNDVPKNSKRYYIPGMPRNGEGVVAEVAEVKSGTVDALAIERSSGNFSVNSKVYFDNQGSGGSEAEALVASVKGKNVQYLDSFENKVVKLTTIQNAYLFTDDILRQPSSAASGTIVGTVKNDNVIVLKDVVGTFDNTGTFSADIKTFFILLDQKSSYTQGATLSLTDGINPPIATAEILNGTSSQNAVEIKVLSGDWLSFSDDYFLQSSDLFNTSGTKIVRLTSLSDNLEPFDVNQSVALVETDSNHGLGIGDSVNIDIFPEDALKTKNYYLRKRLYQEVVFKAPSFTTTIDDTGIGRFQVLNGGADYVAGTYNNVPLTGGTGTGATANITVSEAGIVSNITIQAKGSGYRKADYLGVDDESLSRALASLSTARLTLYVDHVGFAAGSSLLTVDSTTGISNGDLISVGEEILEVTNVTGANITVVTGKENTVAVDHYDGQEVSLYKARYNFDNGFQIGDTGTGFIQSYDLETQKAIIVYDYAIDKNTAQDVKVSSTFFDSSNPSRLVKVSSADPIEFKFEFSEDNVTYIPNPNIDIQEFYKYRFDTSHSSLTGTYFDLSPSKNYNIITTEKLASTVLPGNPGAFTDVKFGFGSRIADNNYQTKTGTDFTNFYYFDKNGIVDSDGKYLKIIVDPLQGTKTVNYVTPNRFVYDITSTPLWDGSGTITYTTTGQFAVGEINNFKITNLGLNYKKVPIVRGVDPNANFKAKATVLFDTNTNTIIGVRADELGSNYVNPKAVIVDGDGVDARFKIVVRNGSLFSITVENPGRGYTYAPVIEIVEGDVEAYVDSNTIGVPQSINIIRNGGAFHLDKTVSSTFSSKYVVALKNFSGDFQKGETVIQKIGNTEVSRSVVSEWRSGSNLLKVENVVGSLRQNVSISGSTSRATGSVSSIFVSTFTENITAFFDNIGSYRSDRGKLGVSNQRLLDSNFYQDYSYVVKSKTPIDQWRELIKSTTHPAGFKLFGQVDIEATAEAEMPAELPQASHFSVIQLWNPDKNKITVENTRRTVTQIVQKVENQRIRRGIGSAATSEFNFNESRAFTVSLDKKFNGILAEDFLGETPVSQTNIQNDTFYIWTPTINQYLDINVSSGDTFVFYKMSVAGNSFEDLGLDLSPNGYPDTRDFSAWEYAYTTGSIPQFIPDNRSEIQGSYFNIPSGVDQFEVIKSNRGKINPNYGSLNAEPFLVDTQNYGRVFTVWFQNDDRIEDLFQDFSVGDIIRWYPVPSNRDAWIDLRVDKVDIDPSYVESSTGLIGRNSFQLLDDNGLPFTPSSAKNLIITLDGVLQEPEVSYTVSGDTITFAEPPLGPYKKLTGSQSDDVTEYSGTTFYGRYFSFKDDQYNNRYFKKIRNIFQRGGRWLDSANQIERNREFIVQESVGYGQEKFPGLDWATKLDDYQRDIGFILDAYEHDVRFGGNIKTVDYTRIFTQDDDYNYITNNKTESLSIFKYATNLAKLAVRNWDVVEQGVAYIQGSTVMTVSDTNRLAVGMHVSSGRAFPEGTKIASIDSDTQITLSRAALENSGGGGGAPQGTTSYDGTSGGNIVAPTSTAVVEPGDTFAIEPGDTFVAPTSFSSSDSATFYFSEINNGTFYDAADIIARNKQFIIEVVIEEVYTSPLVTTPASTETKCRRDIGFFIDAIVYHLRFGGNERVVEYARLYWTNSGYPAGEVLSNLGTSNEIDATVFAWTTLSATLNQAMRQDYDGQTVNGVSFITDSNVAVDNQFPYCAEVASAIDSMTNIMIDIIETGTGAVDPTAINSTKQGNWTSLKAYTNYTIIPDTNLPTGECDDVISSIDSLYDNLDDVLTEQSVTKSLPDYVDGENKEFELYWEDGTPVSTEEDEDLFLSLNAVLQRPKYTAEYPGGDAYLITRDTIPNKLVFDVAPIWDQDFGAKSIGEATAVEKVVGVGVGNYKRLTIDYDLVNGVRTGPFLILDVEDKTVQTVEDREYLYVFLDGVLQREGYSYEVSGPNIYFKDAIKKEMKIDMRYLYGRDVGQILNIYDFAPDTYFATGTLVFEATPNTDTFFDTFQTYSWMGDKIGSPIHAWQVKPDGTYNVIGKVGNLFRTNTTIKFDIIKAQNAGIIDNLDIVFATEGAYDRNTTLSANDHQNNITITLEKDEEGRKLLRSDNQIWAGTILGKTYKNPFVSLSNGDKIRVEGEEKFRNIKKLPSVTTSKDGRDGKQLSNDVFGAVSVETYSGITRGEGLSVIATIENGSVVSLSWNQRSYDPLTQPTAYQYFTPPVLEFIPENGEGGGAKAYVLVSKGQVVSVELVDGGSGYTEAPKVVVARKYQILNERDIGVSLINLAMSPIVENSGIIASSTIDIINLPPPIPFSSSAVIADSPKQVDWELQEEIQLVEETGGGMSAGVVKPIQKFSFTLKDQVQVIDVFTQTNEYVSQVSGRVADIISNSVVTASRQITSTVHNIIQNTSLSNINYFEVAAYTDVDTPANATIIYIPDTSKFKPNGFLMIGDEMVRYMRKLSDRFLMVERGQSGTTPQFWPAGTYLRQVPDPVSVAPAGVARIVSVASVSMVGAASGTGVGTGQDRIRYEERVTPPVRQSAVASRVLTAEVQPEITIDSVSTVETVVRYSMQTPATAITSFSTLHNQTSVVSELQTVHAEFNVRKEATELVLNPPPGGVIDGYQETVFITDPIQTRLNGFVDITNEYGVIKRDSTVVFVANSVFGTGSDYVGQYTRTNVGFVLGMFDGMWDDGTANASGLTLLEMDTFFSALTIRDFVERKDSQYTLSGDKFNILPPSIQNPATSCVNGIGLGGAMTVTSNAYFPTSGYLLVKNNSGVYSGTLSVIQYTGKSGTNTFTGCTLFRGQGLPTGGDEIVPFTID